MSLYTSMSLTVESNECSNCNPTMRSFGITVVFDSDLVESSDFLMSLGYSSQL